MAKDRSLGVVLGQCGASMLAMALPSLWPPATGAVMLVSLRGEPQGAMVGRAVAGGARLLGAGPLPGSILVRGGRDAVATALLRDGVVTLAAVGPTCGDASPPPQGGSRR